MVNKEPFVYSPFRDIWLNFDDEASDDNYRDYIGSDFFKQINPNPNLIGHEKE